MRQHFIKVILYNIFARPRRNRFVQALSLGLLSHDGEAGWPAFLQRLGSCASAVFTVLDKKSKYSYAEIAAVYNGIVLRCLDANIVDADFPAYRAGGLFKNSFPPVRMLQSLAIFCAGEEGSEEFLRGISEVDKHNHHMHLAYSRVLLKNKKYRQAADVALEARRLVEYDYCCTRAVNDTQRALHENGLKPDFHVPQVDNSKRFCEMPFTYLNYAPAAGGPLSMATTCCPSGDWLPMAFEIDSSWNNTDLQAVRASILDGSYKYCDEVRCLPMRDGTLPLYEDIKSPHLRDIIDHKKTEMELGPQTLLLGYDSDCNISCPSCRTCVYTNDKETTEALNERMDKELAPILPGVKLIYTSCFGEALASKHSRYILKSLTPDKYPNLHINLMTNMVLFTPTVWEKLGPATECIKGLLMSIDGGTPATLEKLRRGLKWKRLLQGLAFARDLRRAGKLKILAITFMLQKDNYKELKEMLALASEYCVDSLRIPLLTGHGAYSLEEFNDINICDPQNPLYEEGQAAVEEVKAIHAQMLKDQDAIIASGRSVPEITWRLA